MYGDFMKSVNVILICLAILLAPTLYADVVDTSAEVVNSPPVASSAVINNGFDVTLTEGTNTSVLGTVIITDNNGCPDILGVNGTFYRSAVGVTGADDLNNHYSSLCVSNGDCSGSADITETFNCTFELVYYADPTDAGSIYETDEWFFNALPYDNVSGTADNASVEMSTLTALSITTSIDFGGLALGANTGATNQDTTIINTGNEGIDVSVDGYGTVDGDGLAMNCTIGNISVNYIEYDVSTFTYGGGTQLSDSASDVDLDIAQRTDGESSELLYWGLGLPSSGLSGTCSGRVQAIAVSDPYLL